MRLILVLLILCVSDSTLWIRTCASCVKRLKLEYDRREHEALSALRRETAEGANAIMQIPPEQGQFMALLVKMLRRQEDPRNRRLYGL